MTYKKTSIIKEAQQIRTYIEKNKTIPKSCTLDNGITLSPYSIAYLMSELIQNPNRTDYPLTPVITHNTTQPTTSINEKITRAEYQIMISNFIKYCKENKRVPSYITTISSKKQVPFNLYLYCLTKIIVYYKENKTLPNYCQFKATDIQNTTNNTKTSEKNTKQSTSNCTNPINNKTGCDALGQNTPYYCGVSALQKCLYKFNINISQKQLAQWAGTTTAGTSHQGLRTAIAQTNKKTGTKLTVQEYNFNEIGFEKAKTIICNPNKDIIWHINYRNKYGHYEKVKSINIKTQTLEVINSLGNKCNNNCYCGYIETRSFNTQKQYINGISQKSLIIITRS